MLSTSRRGGHLHASRSLGVNLITGGGVDEALAGVEALVDATNAAATDPNEVVAYFGTITRKLLAAEQKAGVRHHVLHHVARRPDGDPGRLESWWVDDRPADEWDRLAMWRSSPDELRAALELRRLRDDAERDPWIPAFEATLDDWATWTLGIVIARREAIRGAPSTIVRKGCSTQIRPTDLGPQPRRTVRCGKSGGPGPAGVCSSAAVKPSQQRRTRGASGHVAEASTTGRPGCTNADDYRNRCHVTSTMSCREETHVSIDRWLTASQDQEGWRLWVVVG